LPDEPAGSKFRDDAIADAAPDGGNSGFAASGISDPLLAVGGKWPIRVSNETDIPGGRNTPFSVN
jgi:hypothetical protein